MIEQAIYRTTLLLTGLVNLGMAIFLMRHTHQYRRYQTYRMTRILTTLWLVAFGVGYMIHAAFNWRENWPTAASALTATYFHLGAICFSWGYTSLLDPTYLSKKVVVRDMIIYAFGIVCYWSVALCWTHAPVYTALSFMVFFFYAVFGVMIFYGTYNRVSYRMMRLSYGNVGSFVRWMQVCCDLIILFGISSVAITGVFPNEKWPFVVLLIAGVGIFGYIVYSLEKYGAVIGDATKVTLNVVREDKKKKVRTYRKLPFSCFVILAVVAMMLASCEKERRVVQQKMEADSLLDVAYKAHDYQRILMLSDSCQQANALSTLKAGYWRGYAYWKKRNMRLAEKAWKDALAKSNDYIDDLEYYSKTVNRLAGLLYMKFDYEGTIQVAGTAMKLLKEKSYTLNTDYANLLVFVGGCQLRLGHPDEAASNYALAYQHYQQVIEKENTIVNYTSSIIGIINIVNTYIQSGHYREGYDWTERFDNLLQLYREQPQADEDFVDKQWTRLGFYRACALEGLGRRVEARKAYQSALTTRYAKTDEGQIEASNYLIAAHRWSEAANNFKMMDGLMQRYDLKMTLDNIQTYLLPKYLANVGAHRIDSAIAVGTWICHVLDSAIIKERQDASMELATIYDIQQKETEIAEQKASFSHQRFLSTVIILVLVIFGFCLFIYFRYQAAMRLESAYRDLEIANSRAEESSRVKSEFIQQISHEIRTPLNILSGFSQVITSPDMELDEDTRQNINHQITENTNRITGLVNKMLELSDAKSQTFIERKDNVSVVQIASEAVETSGINTAKHLTFDFQVPEKAEKIVLQTNLNAAVRALSLLLDNARKFTAPAGTHAGNLADASFGRPQQVVLRLHSSDNCLYFVVEDTGIGVPEDEAERIFDEFVQLDNYYDGTGIGLTVARSLARRLGGDIVLDTSYKGGARFVMILPMKLDDNI